MRLRHRFLIGFLSTALCAACSSSDTNSGTGGAAGAPSPAGGSADVGGTNAGGSSAAGSDAGGTSAGGMSAGSSTGGSNAGGTSAGGTSAGGTNAGGTSTGGTSAGGMSAGSSAGGSTGGITTCLDASLFSGDPYYSGDLSGWVPTGQPKLADPPLRSEHLAVSGTTVFYDTDFEIWRTDGDNVVRVAGDETDDQARFTPSGACADLRFLDIEGIAALPNGDLVVSDLKGNGLVLIANPMTAACAARPFAGNATLTANGDVTEDVASPGDMDGPGASAMFHGVELPTADADGAVYVADIGNLKIRKIATDAVHTVTTLYDFGADSDVTPGAMTAMNGKLYVAGETDLLDEFWEIDTATGASRIVYQGASAFMEIDSGELVNIIALTNDGTSLFLGSSKGYIWKMDVNGHVLATIAGSGVVIDFPQGVDFTKPVALDQLPLKPPDTNRASMVKLGSDLLWEGANEHGFHVFDIRCQ